ncbi:type II toxin-antitoxin system RelE/ParE family toxin (plasmid) [Pedobacter sp. BS3]|uniref:type II toxin-antitoxin system RelE/ParE family toxin n=1 Tax=Pedobacter sp. BS3 TaxID=2567937 RepID=UPI0011EBEE57|nr:type II toxin-antitoxin system RelE/ParE family toxin [Pedobacter sp. BS3]TZF85838.1 type II toxin-antitoxin system RelE/ParE family toxin [Pedobacter sp. BS3]
MSEKFLRDTYVYGTEFWDFYNSQKKEVQDKIDWVIGLVRTLKIIPEKFFKHLAGANGLYEIRIKVGSNIFRIFCFFDKGNLIILLSGFQKKTDKTPKQEIEKAERLKQRYYEEQAKHK